MSGSGGRTRYGARRQLLPDLELALQNLSSRKLRSFLTMLGMIFGVGRSFRCCRSAPAPNNRFLLIEQLGVKPDRRGEGTDHWKNWSRSGALAGPFIQGPQGDQCECRGVQLSSARKRFTPQASSQTEAGYACSTRRRAGLRRYSRSASGGRTVSA